MLLTKIDEECGFTPVCVSHDSEISGCYAGDLLSWVMSHAECGNIWVTIMSNINVIAVADLCDVACVVIAEGVEIDDDLQALALEKQVNIYKDNRSVYEICAAISDKLK